MRGDEKKLSAMLTDERMNDKGKRKENNLFNEYE